MKRMLAGFIAFWLPLLLLADDKLKPSCWDSIVNPTICDTLALPIDIATDSLCIDTFCIDTFTANEVDVKEELVTPKHPEQKPSAATPHNAQQKACLLCDFLDDVVDVVVGIFKGDAWKPVWGYYDDPGHRTSGPYTVFNTSKGDFTVQLNTIRNNIINNTDHYGELYWEIYNSASTGSTGECNNDDMCPSTLTAKNAAFVYVIGLKTTAAYAATTFSTWDERVAFKIKAQNIIKNNKAYGIGDWSDDVVDFPIVGDVLGLGIDAFNGIQDFKTMYKRSKDLIHLLQAFDMIKWSSAVDITLPNEQSLQSTRDMAASLKDHYVVPMHRRANAMLYPICNNNHAIMTASALGMAAVVLNNYGGYMVFDYESWPDRWAQTANYHIHNNIWKAWWNGPISAPGGVYGWSEGTHYFRTTFQNLLPYMLAQKNYQLQMGQENARTFDYYNYPFWTGGMFANPFASMTMKTMYLDPDYDNLFIWDRNLTMPDGTASQIDDSYHTTTRFNGALAIKGKTLSGDPLCIIPGGNSKQLGLSKQDVTTLDLTVDYLASLNVPSDQEAIKNKKALDEYTQMKDGSTVVNLWVQNKEQHFMNVLAERDVALNSFFHEQQEPGHFTIAADSDLLIMDPPYDGDNFRSAVTAYSSHNTIGHGASWTMDTRLTYNTSSTPVIDRVTHTEFSVNIRSIIPGYADDTRTFKVFKGPYYFYYLIEDDLYSFYGEHSFNINGNGRASGSTFARNGGWAQWWYPCTLSIPQNHWRVTAESIGTPSSAATFTSSTEKHHGHLEIQLDPNDNHTVFSGNMSGVQNATFLTKITPSRCTPVRQDSSIRRNTDDYGLLTTRFLNMDSLRHMHVVKKEDGPDSVVITDPLILGNSDQFVMDGKSSFFSYSENREYRYGSCLSFTNFRAAALDKGKKMKYRDTLYINSNNTVDVSYMITGKFRYKGVITAQTASVVTFFIPDVERYVKMTAKKNELDYITNTHNDSTNWNWITVNFPAGTTSFILVPADPCQASCFFPATADKIDTLFEFNTGTLEPLGHDLQDTTGAGWLRITRGSKMSICPEFVFHNKDSITLGDCSNVGGSGGGPGSSGGGGEGGGGTAGTTPIDDGTGSLRIKDSKRNMIIINDQAALVLDSGSRTYVGAGSTILVRGGGTLLVKKHAMLEVGDDCPVGRGEVICERGSFVCVEQGADLHFFKAIDSSNYLVKLDTLDKHIVYVAMPKQVKDALGNVLYTIAGSNPSTNPAGAHGKFLEDSIFWDTTCVDFCLWKVKNPAYGVNNREFGWCNISYPRARFYMPDTLCPYKPLVIKAARTLNETGYRIKAFQYDTTTHNPGTLLTTITKDSFWLDTSYVFTPTTSGYYYIRLWVHNDCGEQDSTFRILYVPPTPLVSFSLPDSACPGINTVVKANGSASASYVNTVKHAWKIRMLIPDSIRQMGYDTLEYGSAWAFDTATAVTDSFNFPGFEFMGGFKYAVSLTVWGWCGPVTKWDTVNVPLRVQVTGTSHTVYNAAIGNPSVQLTGKIWGAYSSFSWNPTTYLSSSVILNPVSTPTANVTYTFKGFTSWGCVDADTFKINVKKIAKISTGSDTVICGSQKILMGSRLDASLVFGLACYKNPGYKDTLVRLITNYGSLKHFSHRMYAQNYTYYTSIIKTCAPLFDQFIMLYKDSFYKHPNYVLLYEAYQNNNMTTYMNLFNAMVSSGGFLQTICTTTLPSFTYFGGCLNNYVATYRSTGTGTIPRMNVVWSRNDTVISPMSNWMMQSVLVTIPGKYKYVVTDIATSATESDSMMVYMDSLPVKPRFVPAYIKDSIVYFTNLTPSKSKKTSWYWTFGDGKTSAFENPVHTFTRFDSSYIVCLTLTNACGSNTFCDTILVDSTIQGGIYGKTGNETGEGGQGKQAIPVADKLNSGLTNNYLAVNVPNPFSKETVIEYGLIEGYQNAEIRIATPLGQTVGSYPLKMSKGALVIDGARLNDGMYYYSLIRDGVVIATKAMVKN